MSAAKISLKISDEAAEDAALFSDSVGFVHGLKGLPVDYDVFDIIFAARFRDILASWYEIAYLKGHERGVERIKYAQEHGAKRAPGIPRSILEEFECLSDSQLKAGGVS